MDYETALAFYIPVGLAIVGLGSAIALGRAVSAAMDATARQPEASMKILINMIAGCALIEALTIYALVLSFQLMGKM